MTTAEAQIASAAFSYDTPAESPSTSRFTAVNGRDMQQGPAIASNPNGHLHRRDSGEDRTKGQPRITPPGQEKLTITTKPESWSNTVNGDRQGPSYASAAGPDSDSSHKRKRSTSLDRTPAQSSSTSSYHNHALPPTKPHQDSGLGESPEAREASARTPPQHVARDPYMSNSQAHYSQFSEESRDHGPPGGHWYPQNSHDVRGVGDAQNSAVSQRSPEDQLRDALQRDAAQGLDGQGAYTTSPGDDSMSYQGNHGLTALQLQQDHKKRKRNFSNRTKTGCMTCRRRKKKCDETRPECNNCIRGGFVCNGYPSRGQWPKNTEQKQQPIPLQSKDGYDISPNQYSQSSPYPMPPTQQKRESLPGYRGHQLRVDAQQPSRSLMEDSSASTLPSGSVSSPDNRLSAISSYTQSGPFPTPVSARPSAYSQDPYKRVPPLDDPSRLEQESSTPQSAHSTLPQISILHPSHTSSLHPNTPQSTSVQDAARLALSHPASNRKPTQKEEMLSGRPYFPFDRELVLERERCNAACWRFNSSTNPNNGVSPEERTRQFRDILMPKELINISPTLASPMSPAGRVGNNVVVEAPFHCDYGYNIHIGQDVAIGKNCTILDTCEVTIGDRCILGPNVQIYTATLTTEPKKRLGSRGPNMGKSIVIEEDCWIGGGVIILPGRTIRRGSTVGAGSIVTRDVPPFTVVCGNPARVIRGLYPSHE